MLPKIRRSTYLEALGDAGFICSSNQRHCGKVVGGISTVGKGDAAGECWVQSFAVGQCASKSFSRDKKHGTVIYASSVIILRLAWFKVLIFNRRNMSNQLGDYFDVRFNIFRFFCVGVISDSGNSISSPSASSAVGKRSILLSTFTM